MTAPYAPPVFLPDPHNTSASEMNAFVAGIAAYVNALQATVDALTLGVDLSGLVSNGTFTTHLNNGTNPHPEYVRYQGAATGLKLVETVTGLGGGGTLAIAYVGTLRVVQATYVFNGTTNPIKPLSISTSTPGQVVVLGDASEGIRVLIGTS